MVSPELLRRYACFGGMKMEHMVNLARAASDLEVGAQHFFFHEGDDLHTLYLLVMGEAAIVTEVPEKKLEIVTGEVVEGELFGWSGIIPPHTATASARSSTPARVVAFDCRMLREQFDQDHEFAYLLTQRVAQVIRERLTVLRVESLAPAASTVANM